MTIVSTPQIVMPATRGLGDENPRLLLLNATGEAFGLVFRAQRTGTINKVHIIFQTPTINNDTKITVALRTVDSSGLPTSTGYTLAMGYGMPQTLVCRVRVGMNSILRAATVMVQPVLHKMIIWLYA